MFAGTWLCKTPCGMEVDRFATQDEAYPHFTVDEHRCDECRGKCRGHGYLQYVV